MKLDKMCKKGIDIHSAYVPLSSDYLNIQIPETHHVTRKHESGAQN